jgi:hypothetical protein
MVAGESGVLPGRAGTVTLDAGGLDQARQAAGRALAAGALGAGHTVRLDGDRLLFEGGVEPFGIAGGELRLLADGGALYWLDLQRSRRRRGVQSVVTGALAAAAATLWAGLMIHQALPLGAVLGMGWGLAHVRADRRRARRLVEALLANLPLL